MPVKAAPLGVRRFGKCRSPRLVGEGEGGADHRQATNRVLKENDYRRTTSQLPASASPLGTHTLPSPALPGEAIVPNIRWQIPHAYHHGSPAADLFFSFLSSATSNGDDADGGDDDAAGPRPSIAFTLLAP